MNVNEQVQEQVNSIYKKLMQKIFNQLNSQQGLFQIPVKSAADASEVLADGGDPLHATFMKMKSTSGGDADALMNVWQQYLQYQLGEKNFARNKAESELSYLRGLAGNQVSQMMSAGMSRSAALAAVQGVQYQPVASDSQISPQQTNIEGNRTQRMQAIMDIVTQSAQLANQIVSLASAPFDIKSKEITNKLLTNQNDMLEMQVQGMQDAAMFLQAVANADVSRDDDKKIANMPINDQYAYFADMQGKQFDFAKHSASSWQYAQSVPFSRSAGNPFFWATLNEQTRAKNYASASVYEPERAQREVSQLRAAVALTQSQDVNERLRSHILGTQAFIDETTAQARRDMELVKIECQKNGFAFDGKRAEAFLNRVSTFTDLDFAQVDYEIQRLASINDPVVFAKQKAALVEELDFNVAQYIYGRSLASLKNGVLQQMMVTEQTGATADGHPIVSTFPNDELYKWTRTCLQYRELGYSERVNAGTSIARTIFSGVGAFSAGAFASYKIFSALKPAATAAVSAVQAGAPPLPFNFVTPLVVSQPLLEMQMPYGFGGSAAQPIIQ